MIVQAGDRRDDIGDGCGQYRIGEVRDRLGVIVALELEGERQLETLGLDELLTEDSLVLVEWGEKFKSIKKKSTGEIAITSAGGDARKITVSLKEQA